jgi:PAS domain S-box-containing protein
MRLADFIETHMAQVLCAWEAFASTLLPAAGEMDACALRDHAEHILRAVARDLRTDQTRSEQEAKSRGEAPRPLSSPETAAETHAALRAASGFTVQQMAAEYRALRASVLGLWADVHEPGPDTLSDVTRFNEAIDQALAESLNFFAIEAGRSELRYRQLFEHIPDGVFIADAQQRYVDVNHAGCEMLAMTRQELLASRIADVLTPQEHHRLQSELRKLEGGAVTRTEWTFLRKNGTRFIGEVTGRTDQDGSFLGVLRDVTVAHRAEQARLESEQRFRVMADGLPLIIWVHNARGELEYVNNTFCEYFGVTAEDAKGERWKMLTHPDDGDAYIQEFLRCSRKREPFHRQVRVRRADGEWRWLESWGRPRWAGEEFAGMVGTSADVTKRNAAATALQEADRRKDEFLALLAHELRNPLAPLRSSLDILRLAKGNEEAAERARATMQRQVTHMVRLVDDLLDVSRIATGKLELRFEVLDIGQVIESAIETSAPELQAGGHELVSSIPTSTYHVRGDPVRLAQVFSNMLSNAARYTPHGGRIRMNLHAEGSELVVAVTDNGVGIPANMLESVFARFTQVESRDRARHGGLGLGLSLARGLIEMHDGTIVADSAGEGRGSTFTVRLPLVPAVGSKERLDEHGGRGDTRKRAILVVDDNRDAADSLAELLGALGHDQRVAYDGPTALRLAVDCRPDLVLLDIGMPQMDGYEVARRLRALDLQPQPVLVALTGYGQEADRQKSRLAGIQHHLVKPVDLRALQALFSEEEGEFGRCPAKAG